MKNIIFLTLFLSIVTITHAQESETQIQIPQTREEIQTKLELKRQTLQEKISLKRQEIKNSFILTEQIKLKPTTQERVSKAISIAFERLEAFVIRYDGIIQRLEVRIAEMNSEDARIEAIKMLEDARLSLSETTALIIASRTEIEESLTTQTSIAQIKTSIEACKESLKKTHDALIFVIQLIKATDFEDTIALE